MRKNVIPTKTAFHNRCEAQSAFFYLAPVYNKSLYKYRSTALQLLKAQKLSVGLSIGMLLAAAVLTIASNGFSVTVFKEMQDYLLVAVLAVLWLLTEKSMKYRKLYNSQKGM